VAQDFPPCAALPAARQMRDPFPKPKLWPERAVVVLGGNRIVSLIVAIEAQEIAFDGKMREQTSQLKPCGNSLFSGPWQ